MLQFVLSEKGKRMLIYEGFLYHKNKTADTKTYWRCAHYHELHCNSRIVTEADDEVISASNIHTHAANPVDINKRSVINELKSEVENGINVNIAAVVSNKAQTTSDNVLSIMPRRSSLKRTLRRSNNSQNDDPPIPATLEDVDVPNALRYTEKNKQFLFYDSGNEDEERIMIFTTKKNLKVLSQTEHWFGDGTIATCPQPFQQIYTIHGMFEKKVIVLVYALLPGKSRDIYVRLLAALKTLKNGLSPVSFMIDLEIGFVGAIIDEFPEVSIRYCFFHFCKALYGQLSEYALKTRYDNDEEFNIKIKLLMALVYVPPGNVIEVFEQLVESDFSNEDTNVSNYLNYFERQYIGKFSRDARMRQQRLNPRFKIEYWNQYNAVCTNLPRTNNSVEGWHAGFMNLVSKNNATIWTIIRCFRMEHDGTQWNEI